MLGRDLPGKDSQGPGKSFMLQRDFNYCDLFMVSGFQKWRWHTSKWIAWWKENFDKKMSALSFLAPVSTKDWWLKTSTWLLQRKAFLLVLLFALYFWATLCKESQLWFKLNKNIFKWKSCKLSFQKYWNRFLIFILAKLNMFEHILVSSQS